MNKHHRRFLSPLCLAVALGLSGTTAWAADVEPVVIRSKSGLPLQRVQYQVGNAPATLQHFRLDQCTLITFDLETAEEIVGDLGTISELGDNQFRVQLSTEDVESFNNSLNQFNQHAKTQSILTVGTDSQGNEQSIGFSIQAILIVENGTDPAALQEDVAFRVIKEFTSNGYTIEFTGVNFANSSDAL